MVDLFGEPLREGARTDAERAREKRRAKSRAKGFAARPGSGPVGETCGSCKHSYGRRQFPKTYWKCALVKPTKGPGSDIRVRSPACSRWEHKQ